MVLQAYADAHLDLPNRPLAPRSVDWSKYRVSELIKNSFGAVHNCILQKTILCGRKLFRE